jgi:hypothetical protein
MAIRWLGFLEISVSGRRWQGVPLYEHSKRQECCRLIFRKERLGMADMFSGIAVLPEVSHGQTQEVRTERRSFDP